MTEATEQENPPRRLPEEPLALRFNAVCKRYGRTEVIKEFSLDVAAGRFFGLVGVNGAGKTTCIKSMLDFSAIDSGKIEIFGIDHRQTRAREALGFLPERFLPPYYLTGWDFLRYTAKLDQRELNRERAREMCQTLDFSPEALDRSVSEFSKGMGQKLGLCACFLSDKSLLVLDEPMSGLDPKARLLLKRHLKTLRSRGTSVFFSTHMLTDVEELCDEMGILDDGRLQFVGTPQACRETFGESSLEDAYLRCITRQE